MKILYQAIQIGEQYRAIYKKGKDYVKENIVDTNLPESFGHGIDVFLVNSAIELSEKSKKVVEKGDIILLKICL